MNEIRLCKNTWVYCDGKCHKCQTTATTSTNNLVYSIPGLFDEEEIIEGCTVHILRNSVTGECSVGWWRGSKDEMLVKEENCSEKV